MNPKSRGDMLSAGITNAPSGATIMKSKITANCRKASEATTNFWYGVKRLGDFLSAGGMRETRRDYPNDTRPRARLLRRAFDPCALGDMAHHREVLVTPAAKSSPAASRDICIRRELIVCPIQGLVRDAALEV